MGSSEIRIGHGQAFFGTFKVHPSPPLSATIARYQRVEILVRSCSAVQTRSLIILY
jgi:hypothetical protein